MTPRHPLLCLGAALALSACVHPEVPYRKARLLDPMMDPAKTDLLHQSFINEPALWLEKSGGDSGGAMGSSCPTCG